MLAFTDGKIFPPINRALFKLIFRFELVSEGQLWFFTLAKKVSKFGLLK